eukprot:m.159340 g.159340  ORF g.159340 m.159340 type:complete len:594 (+) comp14341_c0_seq1:723-2504(+)
MAMFPFGYQPQGPFGYPPTFAPGGFPQTRKCAACAMEVSSAQLQACGPVHFYVCTHCVNFFVRAISKEQLRQHLPPPTCSLKDGLLSVRSCYGCLYQRCVEVNIRAAPSVIQAFAPNPVPELPAIPSAAVSQPMTTVKGGKRSSSAAGRPKSKRSNSPHSRDEVGVAQMLVGMNATGAPTQSMTPHMHSGAATPVSMSANPMAVSTTPSGMLQAQMPFQAPVMYSISPMPSQSATPHGMTPISRADSKSERRTPKYKRGSSKGFCLGCWKTKELEERYALGMSAKFMLCNACRKTHLTKAVIPVFERKARQPPQGTDPAMQRKIRDEMEAEWMAGTKDPTVCRLLDLWLNLDWRRVVLNGVCSYVPSEEIQHATADAVRRTLGARDEAATPSQNVVPKESEVKEVATTKEQLKDKEGEQDNAVNTEAETDVTTAAKSGEAGSDTKEAVADTLSKQETAQEISAGAPARASDQTEAAKETTQAPAETSSQNGSAKPTEEMNAVEGTMAQIPQQLTIRFLRVAGHLHAVDLGPIPISRMVDVRAAVKAAIVCLVDDAVQQAIAGNNDLADAITKHSLVAEEIRMTSADVELLLLF